MFVVGGASMALAYNTRRATRDIDAVFEPKATIYQAATRIAQHHGLDHGWLNDSVKGLLPGPDPAPQEIAELPGLRVSVASPQYSLALKVAAARVDRDADDIRFLVEEMFPTALDDRDSSSPTSGNYDPSMAHSLSFAGQDKPQD
jgi:hypothetical protein